MERESQAADSSPSSVLTHWGTHGSPQFPHLQAGITAQPLPLVKVFFCVNEKILFVFSPLSFFLLFLILCVFFHIFDFLIPVLLFALLSPKHLELLTITNAGSTLCVGVSSQLRES